MIEKLSSLSSWRALMMLPPESFVIASILVWQRPRLSSQESNHSHHLELNSEIRADQAIQSRGKLEISTYLRPFFSKPIGGSRHPNFLSQMHLPAVSAQSKQLSRSQSSTSFDLCKFRFTYSSLLKQISVTGSNVI